MKRRLPALVPIPEVICSICFQVEITGIFGFMNGPFGKICGNENGSKIIRIFPFWFLPLKNYTCLHFALFLCHVHSTSSLRIFLLDLPRDDINLEERRTGVKENNRKIR